MQKLFWGLILIIVFNACYADITGHYSCKGNDAFLSLNYSGTLDITKNDTTYQLVWNIDHPIGRFHGTGLFDPKHNILGFMFVNQDESSQTGVGIYEINSSGSVSGYWTYQFKDQPSYEACTLISKEAS